MWSVLLVTPSSQFYFSGNMYFSLFENICSHSIINISYSVSQMVVFNLICIFQSPALIFLDVDVTENVRFWFARAVLFKFSFPCVDRNWAGLRGLSMWFCVCSISG